MGQLIIAYLIVKSQVIFGFNVSDLFHNSDKFVSWFIEGAMGICADFHLFEVIMAPLESGFIQLIVNWGAPVFLLYWLEDLDFLGSAHLYGILLSSFDVSVAFKFLDRLFWLTLRSGSGFILLLNGLKTGNSASDDLLLVHVAWFFLLDGIFGSWFSNLADLLDLDGHLGDVLVDLSLAFSLCLEVSLVLSANSDTFGKVVKWRHF